MTNWLLSMPTCGEVNRARQELTSVSYNSGEQNKDITQARQSRVWKDTQTLLIYLLEKYVKSFVVYLISCFSRMTKIHKIFSIK